MSMTPIQVELEALREAAQGLLTAEAVVIFARDNPSSALHGCFEWDDEKASHQFRLIQARQVIRTFVVMLPRSNKPIRAYVSLTSDRIQPGGGYRSISDVMTHEDRRNMLLKEALREARRFRQRFDGLVELAELFGAIDQAVAAYVTQNDIADLHVEGLNVLPPTPPLEEPS